MIFGDPIDTIHGLTIFKDFSNDSQFYYFPPETPQIARVVTGALAGKYAIKLIVYRRDIEDGPAPEGVEDGGGFLAVDVDLAVSDQLLAKVRDELQSRGGGQVTLTQVPFIDGSVSLTLFGRTSNDDAPVTGASFVRKLLGSTKPSLYGSNRASFSVVLDQQGAVLMKDVLEAGGLVTAVVQYDLSYQTIRPAYNLEVIIHYASAYESLRQHMGASFGLNTSSQTSTGQNTAGGTARLAQPGGSSTPGTGVTTNNTNTTNQTNTGIAIVGQAQFNHIMEDLKETRAVEVHEVDFGADPTAHAGLSPEQINSLIADLMGSTWFKPTLAPIPTQNTVFTGAPSAPIPTAPQPARQPTPGATPLPPIPMQPVPLNTPTAIQPPLQNAPATAIPAPTPTAVTPPAPTPTAATPPAPAPNPAPGGSVTPGPTVPSSTPTTSLVGDPPPVRASPTITTAAPTSAAAQQGNPGVPSGALLTPTNTTSQTQSVDNSSSSVQLSASFEINITEISQQQHIDATYELNRAQAVTRQIHPSGQLVLDLTNDDAKNYVQEVSLKDDFFHRIQIHGSSNADWDTDKIQSVLVELRYGKQSNGNYAALADFLINATQTTFDWQTWAIPATAGGPLILWYDYRVTVHYKPELQLGDESGGATSQGLPGADPDGWICFQSARNLVISPRDLTPVHPVKISTGVLRFDLVQEVRMRVSAGAYSQTYRLLPESHDIELVVRPEPGQPRPSFKTSGTLFYKDDPSVKVALPETEWNPEERLVVVDEPDEQMLRVRIVCVNPNKMFAKVSVTMKYQDGPRVVQKDFDLTDNGQSADFVVRLTDPTKTKYMYMVAAQTTAGAFQVDPAFKEADSRFLAVGYPTADVIPVVVRCLQPVPTGKLMAIEVELAYDDDANDVHWSLSQLIGAGNPTSFNWTIPIKDAARRSYRYKVTAFRPPPDQNVVLDWQTIESPLLILPFFPT